MTERRCADWLQSFIEYASFGEAPPRMYFWVGVSAIAGALRRKVWIDQVYFKWYCNSYVIIVAPPGIVSKSTTAGIGMNLLRKVPGMHFGPDIVTWPALVTAFAESTETFITADGTHHPMSAITLESSEFGNLLNPQDREMVDLLVSLWDGKQGTFEKKTKHSGNDSISNPWINLIACTTPSWIAGNFPEYMVGGGFTSRCVFVYADKKHRHVAYPGLEVPSDIIKRASDLIHDLELISTNLAGEYKLTDEAIAFGRKWYEHHYSHRPPGLDDDQFGGYIARKQTHIHKLAMILSAATSDKLEISAESLKTANEMVTDLETDMPKVFSRIGRSEISVHTERLVSFVRRRGKVAYSEAYRHVHLYMPSMRDFEDVLAGCIRARYISMSQEGDSIMLSAMPGEPELGVGVRMAS